MTKQAKRYQDFSGGLSEVANDQMRDNQLVKAQNTAPGDGYGISKPSGTEIAMPRIESGEAVMALVELKPLNAAPQTLAFTASTLYRLDGAVWTQIIADLKPIKDWFIQAGKIWWLDGEKLRRYDGTEAKDAELATPSASNADKEVWGRVCASSFVEHIDGRWFYARAGANEVIYTEVGAPDKIKATYIFNFDTKNAETITALQAFNDGLLVFKDSTIDFLQTGNFATGVGVRRVPLSVTSGTAFAKTVQVVDNAVLYLGGNGLYRLKPPNFNSAISAENISEQLISKRLKNFKPKDAYAAVYEGVYHFYLQNDTELQEYRYYMRIKSFYGPFTQDAACYATGLTEKGLYLGCKGGYILRHSDKSYNFIDTATGEVRPIVMEATTKGFDITDSMVRDAKLKRVQVAAKQHLGAQSHLHVMVKADYSETAFEMTLDESLVYDVNELGDTRLGWKDTVVKEFSLGKKAKRMQITFRNDKPGETVLVYGVACQFKPKRPKGNREGVSKGVVEYDKD